MNLAPLGPLTRWVRRQVDPGAVELVCAEGTDSALAGAALLIRADTCLAEASAVDFLELVAGGFSRVEVRASDCGNSVGLNSLLGQVIGLLEHSLAPRSVVILDAPSPTNKRRGARRGRRHQHRLDELPVSRRTLFGLSRPRRDGPDPQAAVGDRMRAACTTLQIDPRELARGDQENPHRLSASNALVLKADGCTGCKVCVRVCPSDALQMNTSRDDSGRDQHRLIQDLAGCVGCRACLDACPAFALTEIGQATWSDALGDRRVLTLVEASPCTRCGAPVLDGQSLCQICRARVANPFGTGNGPKLSPSR